MRFALMLKLEKVHLSVVRFRSDRIPAVSMSQTTTFIQSTSINQFQMQMQHAEQSKCTSRGMQVLQSKQPPRRNKCIGFERQQTHHERMPCISSIIITAILKSISPASY